MNIEIARNLRKKAGKLACRSLVYNWSLGGCIPARLDIKPADPWPGDAERGRWLCSGTFDLGGEKLEIHGNMWEPFGASSAWYDFLHGFEWLRDLRALGGDAARAQARDMVENWIDTYPGWDEKSWRPDLLGGRIAIWIALYDFFCASADENMQQRFLESLVRQTRHLGRSISSMESGEGVLYACKGLLFAGVALSGYEQWIEQSLDRLVKELDRQILSDGGHISRNPGTLVTTLQLLLDIRCALLAVNYPLPEKVQHAIDRICPALRFFRYPDKHLAVFNGTCEGNRELMDMLMVHANARGKALRSLPETGYERVSTGRSVLMFDGGASPAWPFDENAHCAPLAFEFSYGRERLFVNCGTHHTSGEWRELLRGTAAHNTVTLNYRNACEIKSDGHVGRKARKVTIERQESNDACLIDASHDGYVPLNGVSHRRRLFLADSGHDLRGEDTLTCSTGLGRPLETCIRFHLHPKVQVSLVNEGQEALLRLPSGSGWRFSHAGGELALDDSIYLCSDSAPRKTKQLVISGLMESDLAQIKWRLAKERQ